MSKVQRVALLSNPEGPVSLAELPRIRAFCAEHPHIFHYEVEEAGQVGDAMRSIARIQPSLLAINGGKPTIDAALAELDQLGAAPPRIEVIPGGKVEALRRLMERAA